MKSSVLLAIMAAQLGESQQSDIECNINHFFKSCIKYEDKACRIESKAGRMKQDGVSMQELAKDVNSDLSFFKNCQTQSSGNVRTGIKLECTTENELTLTSYKDTSCKEVDHEVMKIVANECVIFAEGSVPVICDAPAALLQAGSLGLSASVAAASAMMVATTLF